MNENREKADQALHILGCAEGDILHIIARAVEDERHEDAKALARVSRAVRTALNLIDELGGLDEAQGAARG